jgi:hypothetical protein
MRVRRSLQTPKELDPDWFKEFAFFLNNHKNEKKTQEVKKIFIQSYFENIQEGMNPKEAIQKAKTLALCFLTIHR